MFQKNAPEGMLPKFKYCRLATLLERKETRASLHLFARARDRFVNPNPKPQLPLERVVRQYRFGNDFQVQNHAFRWCQLGGLAVFKMRFGENSECEIDISCSASSVDVLRGFSEAHGPRYFATKIAKAKTSSTSR